MGSERAAAESNVHQKTGGPAELGSSADKPEVLCLGCRAPLDPTIKRDKNYCFSCAVHASCACADD